MKTELAISIYENHTLKGSRMWSVKFPFFNMQIFDRFVLNLRQQLLYHTNEMTNKTFHHVQVTNVKIPQRYFQYWSIETD